jgi:hypothetical protein
MEELIYRFRITVKSTLTTTIEETTREVSTIMGKAFEEIRKIKGVSNIQISNF